MGSAGVRIYLDEHYVRTVAAENYPRVSQDRAML